jgi:hypothetical protein
MRKYHGVVAVDLDNYILEFDENKWLEEMDYFGQPKEGAIKFLKQLQKLGYKILIHAARIDGDRIFDNRTILQKLTVTSQALQDRKIPYDSIWFKRGKPHADFYLDDKIVLSNDWNEILKTIRESE